MPLYRVYTITPDEHIHVPPTVIECRDDQAAIEEARQVLDGRVIEVWQMDRRVIRLEAKR
jgi:hypothetical protein